MHRVMPCVPKLAARALGALVLLAAVPREAGAQTRITAGTTDGALVRSDSLVGGRHMDLYLYRGRGGERLRIELWSTQFDPYLAIRRRESTAVLASNDNIGQNNRSSRITVTLPGDGEYLIRVTSTPSRPRATGPYRISVQSGDRVVIADPPPPPSTSPSRPPPPPPPPPPTNHQLRVCVVQNGSLVEVWAQYNPMAEDTTYNGQPFATAFPATAGYAASATWYVNKEPIRVNGRTYVQYGLPRVLGVGEVTRMGEYRGVTVFVEAGITGTPEVIYMPVRPGCEFQPYQIR